MRSRLSHHELERYAEEIRPLTLGLETLDDHAVIMDTDTHILYTNDAVERVTGYAREETLGRRPRDLWSRTMQDAYRARIRKRLIKERRSFVGEVQHIHKDGHLFWQELRISPVLDRFRDVRFLVAIAPEISKRKEVEEIQRGFSSVVSHQIRNMLCATTLLTDLLQMSTHLDAEERHVADMLHQSNDDMVKFINDLMIVTRAEQTGEMVHAPFDLAREIALIIENEQRVYPGIRYLYIQPIEPVTFDTSKSFALQVFSNIIANASEYSDPKAGKVEVRLQQANGAYVFTCIDNGIGIPIEDQPKIFSKLFRARNANTAKPTGTGLGLAIVKMIADKLGWDVSFSSAAGAGATFVVRMPTS